MKRLLQDIGIMKKILAMLLLLGGVAIVTAGVNAWKIRAIDARYAELIDRKLPAVAQMVRSHRQTSDILRHGFRAVTYPQGSAASRTAAADADAAMAALTETIRKAEELDPALTPSAEALLTQTRAIHRTVRDAIARADAGDQAGAVRLLGRADAMLEEFSGQLKESNDRRIAATDAEAAALAETTDRNLFYSILLTLIGTGVALVLAHVVVKGGIVRPLLELKDKMGLLAAGDHQLSIDQTERADEIGAMSRAVQVFRDQAEERAQLEAAKKVADAEQQQVVDTLGDRLDRLADGDLTVEIGDAFPDAYRQLRTAFNGAVERLGELIRTVGESTAEIRTGSSEIAQASEDLARRTEGNAASLEQTSAAIQQMDQRLRASATSSSQTVARADQTIATVSGGRERADEAVQAMGRVSESAKGIDSVIEGLDKIAFQTRVLAMNAAVEAGRAGEAGRGFAVVADLVSALAMRAEEEAKRARDQLTVTQTDIVTAVGAVEKVDSALQDISTDVGEVHQLLGSMATDNQAQAQAISEINAAIASMDQSTQQNAAMVEETSAAARNLLKEVDALGEQASRFRHSGRPAARTVVAPPPVATPKPAAAAEKAKPKAASPRVAKKPVVPKPAGAAPADIELPRHGKEGAYQSPVAALPAAAIPGLTEFIEDDWKEF